MLEREPSSVVSGRGLDVHELIPGWVGADGRIVWVRDRAFAFRDQDGQVLREHGLLFDVTGSRTRRLAWPRWRSTGLTGLANRELFEETPRAGGRTRQADADPRGRKNADIAMYRAKRLEPGSVLFAADADDATERLSFASRLRQSVADPDRRDLHPWGLRLAIDDFGTGYSSLSRLKHHAGRRAEDRPGVHPRRGWRRASRRHGRTMRSPKPGHDPAGRRHRDRGRVRLPALQRMSARAGFWFAHPMPADRLLELATRRETLGHPAI